MTRKELGKTVFENLTWEKFGKRIYKGFLILGKMIKMVEQGLGLGKAKVKTLKFALHGAISCSGNNMYVEANKTQ